MKRLLLVGMLGALAIGLVFTVLAAADNGKPDLRSGGDGPLTLAVYGDAPYSNVAADYTKAPPNETSEFDATPAFIDAVNATTR